MWLTTAFTTTYDYGEGVTLQVYALADGKKVRVEIPSAGGTGAMMFEVKREGRSLQVTGRGISKPWQLLLVGIAAVDSVENGMVESNTSGVRVTPKEGAGGVRRPE